MGERNVGYVRGGEKQLGKCIEEGVIYKITCMGCFIIWIEANYVGETSRDLFSRILEHMTGLENRKPENTLLEHCIEVHNASMQVFKVEMIGKAFTAFVRQVNEAVTIANKTARYS